MNLLNLIKNDFFNQYQEILTSDWIEWQDEGIAVAHCAICQVLNGCWFRDDNKPQMPQHPNCHCKRLFIEAPVPNETGRATCDIRKFTEYLFSRINIEISLTKNGKKIKLITGWMVRPKGLITCNTPLGG